MTGLTLGTLLQFRVLIIMILPIAVTHCVAKLIMFKLFRRAEHCNETEAHIIVEDFDGCELLDFSNDRVGVLCVCY